MRESVLLVLLCLGGSAFLYGVGLPLGLVVALAITVCTADFMMLRYSRRAPTEKGNRHPERSTQALPTGEQCDSDDPRGGIKQKPQVDASTDAPAPDERPEAMGTAPEPEWKRQRFLRVPARRDEPEKATHQATPDRRIFQFTAPPTRPAAAPLHDTRGKTGIPEKSQAPFDPLAQYQPEQFNTSPRSAPVEAFTFTADTSPPNMPMGPAWEPPPIRRRPDRTQAPNSPRPVPAILKPEDYQRNAGLRGYLYLARNPEHWEGLFKVGQTIRHPTKRVDELNTLHAQHKDIGKFDLLDVVEVVDAYGAEQVLFKVLNDLRPVQGREFFIADHEYLRRAMTAVADFIRGQPDELNRIYRDLDPGQFPSWPGRVPWYNHHGVARAKGWVYLARCQFHYADTYLFGATSSHPNTALKELNEGQRLATPQIGFYTVVFALPVSNTTASRTMGWRAMSAWKLKGSRSYIRGPLEQISRALKDSLSTPGT